MLQVENPSCLRHGFPGGGGDVPLVQSGQTHGNTFLAVDHAAGDIDFAAHVERVKAGEFLTDGADDVSVDTGTHHDVEIQSKGILNL